MTTFTIGTVADELDQWAAVLHPQHLADARHAAEAEAKFAVWVRLIAVAAARDLREGPTHE